MHAPSMDVFLDLTGTITSVESENYAFYKMCEAIKKRFEIDMSAEQLMHHILEFRKPYMDNREKIYYPIRNLIVRAVENVVSKRLCSNDVFWIIDAYTNYHAKYVKPDRGSEEALKIIRRKAEHLGLITDADRPYTEKVLRAMNIYEIFDSITTAEDAGVGKPNPKIFEMALKNSRSKPVIYVGDSEKRDILGARRVGMITIKVGKPSEMADYNTRNLLEAARIIDSLTQ